jgi:hypothetical protein
MFNALPMMTVLLGLPWVLVVPKFCNVEL